MAAGRRRTPRRPRQACARVVRRSSAAGAPSRRRSRGRAAAAVADPPATGQSRGRRPGRAGGLRRPASAPATARRDRVLRSYASCVSVLPLVDYHVHTARCGHAAGAMERYVERAIEAGLTELGFSDHLFLYWLPADQRDPEVTMAEWEHDFYIQDVERCRERYASDITIRLSIEADYIPGHEQKLASILQRCDWDY